jgi:hypothetical protein
MGKEDGKKFVEEEEEDLSSTLAFVELRTKKKMKMLSALQFYIY